MKDKVLNEIIDFIETEMGTYRRELSRNTKLEKDLGISGDDAWELIEKFSARFSVDITHFDAKKYFSPEGDGLLNLILVFLSLKNQAKQKELKLGDLERAVKIGKLDKSVIEFGGHQIQ